MARKARPATNSAPTIAQRAQAVRLMAEFGPGAGKPTGRTAMQMRGARCVQRAYVRAALNAHEARKARAA